ncbi:MAG: CvpA family protein, partial [Oscillospiraceae bacterium]|nr:CvpA family protein [Oscillospiraceae bacterium]
IPGAEEYSAMNSAAGAVQDLKYSATFPLLLNISGEPTYFMALKDSSHLVKMYAMVNVRQYQIVATGATVETCLENYASLLRSGGITEVEVETVETETVSGTVEEIRSAVLDGTTYFFVKLEAGEVFYQISAVECREAVLLNAGDEITLTVVSGDGMIAEATALER